MEKNSPSTSQVKIFLDTIEVDLKIGICAHEQDVKQRVIVDVELFADPQSYLNSVSRETIIDYARVYETVTGWAERDQVELIEDYLKELMALCFAFESVTAIRLAIKKANIFGQNQGAGVQLFMNRADL